MADLRTIVDFFNSTAPSIGITPDTLNNPQQQSSTNNNQPSAVDQLIQAYNFLCDIIFEEISAETGGGDLYNNNDRGAADIMARPNMIIKVKDRMSILFPGIGGDHFCYTDLVQPDARRTRNFLAQMIRFCNFKCGIVGDLDGIDNEIEDQYRNYEFQKELEQKTGEQLNREKEQLANLESRRQNLEKTEFERKQKLDAKKAEVNHKKKAAESVEHRLNDVKAKIEEAKKKIVELTDTGKRLDLNIVNSPERMLGELKQLETERTNMQRKLDKAQQECRKLEREMTETTLVSQSVDALGEEVRKIEAAQQEMLKMRGIGDKFAQEVNELELRKKDLIKQLEHSRKAAEIEVQSLQKEVASCRKEIEAIQRQKTQLESDEKEMADRLVKVKENIRQHQQNIKRKERSFLIARDEYDDAVAKMMKDCRFMETKLAEHQAGLNKINAKAMSVLAPTKK